MITVTVNVSPASSSTEYTSSSSGQSSRLGSSSSPPTGTLTSCALAGVSDSSSLSSTHSPCGEMQRPVTTSHTCEIAQSKSSAHAGGATSQRRVCPQIRGASQSSSL